MKDLKKEIEKIKSHIQDVEKHLEAFNNYLSIAESFDNHLENSATLLLVNNEDEIEL